MDRQAMSKQIKFCLLCPGILEPRHEKLHEFLVTTVISI